MLRRRSSGPGAGTVGRPAPRLSETSGTLSRGGVRVRPSGADHVRRLVAALFVVVLAASFLPRTGAQIAVFLLLAAILIGAGRLLVVLARRRNHAV
jgi:LPXTG-motif cell wall-anchored protein